MTGLVWQGEAGLYVFVGVLKGLWDLMATVLPLFKARWAHGIPADGKIFMKLLGCLARLYSWVGGPHTLQAACLSACLMS